MEQTENESRRAKFSHGGTGGFANRGCERSVSLSYRPSRGYTEKVAGDR